jgi:hypothetical protein
MLHRRMSALGSLLRGLRKEILLQNWG